MNGVILSDGSVCRREGYYKSYFSIGLSGREHLDWLHYIKKALECLGVTVNPKYPNMRPAVDHNGRPYEFCRLGSRTSPLLTGLRNTWYPESIKVVPVDLELTPLCLANWFMGDGSSSWNNDDPALGVFASFATQGYGLQSIERLEHRLSDAGFVDLSRRHTLVRRGAGISIRLNGQSARLLMEVVESHILPSYAYKVKHPGHRSRVESQTASIYIATKTS